MTKRIIIVLLVCIILTLCILIPVVNKKNHSEEKREKTENAVTVNKSPENSEPRESEIQLEVKTDENGVTKEETKKEPSTTSTSSKGRFAVDDLDETNPPQTTKKTPETSRKPVETTTTPREETTKTEETTKPLPETTKPEETKEPEETTSDGNGGWSLDY